jgi:hypothetical protein
MKEGSRIWGILDRAEKVEVHPPHPFDRFHAFFLAKLLKSPGLYTFFPSSG